VSWIDDLKTRIDALKDEDWETEVFLIPAKNASGDTGHAVKLRIASIELPVDTAIANEFFALVGCVNSMPCAGMSPEKIYVNGLSIDSVRGPMIHFAIRNTTPWTHFVDANGKYQRLTDATGKAVYRVVDFNAVTETKRA
jgi:hypothetical protein